MISPEQLPFITAAAGLLVGILITWLIFSSKNKGRAEVDAEKLKSEQQRSQQSSLNQQALQTRYEALHTNERALRQTQTELEVRLQEEKKAAAEKAAAEDAAEDTAEETTAKSKSRRLEAFDSGSGFGGGGSGGGSRGGHRGGGYGGDGTGGRSGRRSHGARAACTHHVTPRRRAPSRCLTCRHMPAPPAPVP